MKHLLIVSLLLGLTSCASRTALFSLPEDRLVERLENERNRLQRENDPVDRTRTHIRISDVLLALVSHAVQENNTDLMQTRVGEYVETIQEAHEIMTRSGRDAHRSPGGFKDLEISLRRQTRQLQDIGGALTFDQRQPVERAREEAADIRDDLLRALFGEQNVSTRS